MHATSSTPSTSVLSSLHSTLGSLQNAFPSTLTSHLHPFSSTSSDIFAQRERLTKDIATIKRSLESFRQSWTAEKEVVDTERPALKITEPSGSGQDSRELDSELERRKLGMIRVMMDWCHNDNTLLSTSSSISKISPPPKRLHKTPFVHAQTLVNPTERLQAVAVSIPLDVYLNNEDPDLGNATDQPGNVRIDTLSFGGERMAIDMDIQHPRWETKVVGAGRYTIEDGWQVVKCEVSYFPLGGEMAEPIVLPWMSEVLSSYLARYIMVVNTYQLDLKGAEVSDDDSVLSVPFADENESLALQAEKIILDFSENVARIATLDKRMKKVEFEAVSSEPVTPRPIALEETQAERNWFVEAENLGLSMKSLQSASMSANEHQGIFPSFIIPSGTVSGSGPKCTMKPLPKSHGRTALLSPYPLKAYETMEVDQLENRALLTSSGWMLEFEEDVLVSQGGIAAGPSTAGSTEPSRTKIAVPTDGSIDSLIIPDSLRSATFRHHTGRPEEPVLRFNLGPSGVQGVHVSRIGLQDFEVIPLVEQAKSIAETFHLDLLLTQMQLSCFQQTMREETAALRGQEEIDAELDLLMSGGKLPHLGFTFTVTRYSTWLEVSMPLPVDGQVGLRLMVISITPRFVHAGQVEMKISQQGRPEGTSLDSALVFDTKEAGKKLADARYNVPIWLEWVTKHIQN